ncbi:MAG TPA: hypothetical protein VHB93_02355 [Candidatus Paceibacterota bacterium]|nr:hypothetical protein [Candidatus Paceibacterota bacterium]
MIRAYLFILGIAFNCIGGGNLIVRHYKDHLAWVDVPWVTSIWVMGAGEALFFVIYLLIRLDPRRSYIER